jgi:hypothetical protein
MNYVIEKDGKYLVRTEYFDYPSYTYRINWVININEATVFKYADHNLLSIINKDRANILEVKVSRTVKILT